MAKKSGKKKKSRKAIPNNPNRNLSKSFKRKKTGNSTKLDQILSVEKKLLNEEMKIEDKESKLEKEEKKVAKDGTELKKIESMVDREESDLEKLKKIEIDIKNQVGEHPLAKIGAKDVIKGLIGAFIGLSVHYTFIYGVKITEHMSIPRAIFLMILAFFIGLAFIYATGFRKVKDPKILMFMPLRIFVLYACAIIMSIVVLLIFYPEFGHTLEESFKMISGVMLAAMIGACTADLVGKD